MKQVLTKACTGVLNVDSDWTPDKPLPPGALPVAKVEPSGATENPIDKLPQWTSFWRPTARELEAIRQGAAIEVCLISPFQPPIDVSVTGTKA